MPTTTSAAIYARGETLAEVNEQIDACKQYIQANSYELAEDHIFKTFDNSPLGLGSLMGLLGVAGRGEITILVVTRRGRLHKDPDDVTTLVDILARSGVTVEEVSHG